MMRGALSFVLACGLAIGAQPSMAQTLWPMLFDVRGVAADDTLNIRETPSAEAAIIGTIAFDARNVEVVRDDDTGRWGLVNHYEGTGWVAMRYLQPVAGVNDGYDIRPASCYGTEPFWDLTFGDNETVVYEAYDGAHPGKVVDRLHSTSRIDVRALDLVFDGTGYDKAVALLRRATCSDGMSDREFGIEIDLLLRGGPDGPYLISGCCSLGQ